jgi:raffinose/stachyose/melibiose transport system permease protein
MLDGRIGRLTAYVILGLAVAQAVFPLALAILNSLKTSLQISQDPLALPTKLEWINYANAWEHARLGSTLLNSAFVVSLTVLIVCCTAAPAAYVLARRRVRHWQALSFYFLATTTIPTQLFLYPLYFAFARLGLINSRAAIAVIYAAMYTPFSISLLRTYVLAVPIALEEAAKIDGATSWQVFRHVIFPLLRPGLLTVALITGLHAWNEFVIAITFLQGRTQMTAIGSFYALNGQYTSDWGEIMAAAVIIVLPIVALFISLQRHFIEGMAAGSVKG